MIRGASEFIGGSYTLRSTIVPVIGGQPDWDDERNDIYRLLLTTTASSIETPQVERAAPVRLVRLSGLS